MLSKSWVGTGTWLGSRSKSRNFKTCFFSHFFLKWDFIKKPGPGFQKSIPGLGKKISPGPKADPWLGYHCMRRISLSYFGSLGFILRCNIIGRLLPTPYGKIFQSGAVNDSFQNWVTVTRFVYTWFEHDYKGVLFIPYLKGIYTFYGFLLLRYWNVNYVILLYFNKNFRWWWQRTFSSLAAWRFHCGLLCSLFFPSKCFCQSPFPSPLYPHSSYAYST